MLEKISISKTERCSSFDSRISKNIDNNESKKKKHPEYDSEFSNGTFLGEECYFKKLKNEINTNRSYVDVWRKNREDLCIGISKELERRVEICIRLLYKIDKYIDFSCPKIR